VNRRPLAAAVALATLLALGGCGGGSAPTDQTEARLTGTVTYRERMALPPGARVEVRLEDVTEVGAPAEEVASQTIATDGKQVPIAFELRYPLKSIQPTHRYGVRASIVSADGELLFTSSEHKAVFTDGGTQRNIDIMVQRAGTPPPRTEAGGPAAGDAARDSGAGLPGGTWRLVAIQRPGATEEAVGMEPRYTVAFENGKVSGLAHCNRFTGGYEQPAPGELKVSPMAATLMACPGESIESEFLKALGGATRYELRDDRLLLSYGGGGVLAFARDEPAAAVERPAGAAAAAAADSPPSQVAAAETRTFVFDCDGDLSFVARFGSGAMALAVPKSLGGEQLALPIARSASGARYQRGDTVFWNKGDLATIEYRGQRYVDCKQNPSKASSAVPPSPHDDIR
jgi:putative lipoprotein